MNKYCFEMYEKFKSERKFVGYKTVKAESSEEARIIIKSKLSDDIQLAEIYIPQD